MGGQGRSRIWVAMLATATLLGVVGSSAGALAEPGPSATTDPPTTAPTATTAAPEPTPPPAVDAPSPSPAPKRTDSATARSEEHTSELQSQPNIVCRLLLEPKH